MSTRSSIAVQHADGTVDAVYCHFDGYLSGVGAALVDGFKTYGDAASLVALGDLSTVCREVVAYSRDRGEDFEQVKPHRYASLDDYYKRVGDDIGDNGFRYVFVTHSPDGGWKAWGRGVDVPAPLRSAFVDLAAAVAAEEARSDAP